MLSLLFVTLSLFFQVASALRNFTIDDNSPLITYRGEWAPSSIHLSGLDYGGSHTVSSDANASATFTFTGVAVFYVAPRWPYTVNTQLSLDGAAPVVVDLTDPIASKTALGGSESALSSVAWSQEDLSNTTHTLVLTMASTGQFIIADGFIFTVDNGSSPSSSPFSSSASQPVSMTLPTLSATSSGPAATSSAVPAIRARSNTLAIAVGSGVGALALLIAGLSITLFTYKRRHRQKPRKSNVLDEWGADYYPPPPAPFIIGAPARQSHQPSMSDASSPLESPGSSRNPFPRVRSDSTSEYTYGASSPHGSTSKSAYGYGYAPRAEPRSYDKKSELASENGSIACTVPSAGIVLAAVGSPLRAARREKAVHLVYKPAPPGYEESALHPQVS
ncbi:hypothetical protein C8R47DRAFT_643779 [Mycena vitilis]|nr:hypothetical protein C8R47DRAFT_643779 [Mycena vitilis]